MIKLSTTVKTTVAIVLVMFLGVTSPASAESNKGGTLKVAKLVASVGEKTSGFISVAAGSDKGSRIPVTLINGAKKGPTLALIAGTHGYEYAPIMALQNIAQQVNPASLSGNLIIVHVANMPSFLARTIYYSPVDGQNLNRAYPGKADGSLSERIAHALTTDVIKQADYLVDMHSGDGNEALRPYIYMPKTGKAKFDATIKGMAMSFGLDHIIIDSRAVSKPENSTYTDMTALTLGIPAMTTEVGALGSTDPKWVKGNIRGVKGLMRHLNMIKGKTKPAHPIVWLGKYEVITSPETGVFKATIEMGYSVAKGGKLGELYDFFGNKIATITAPFAGVVNYVIGTPPISKGEPLAMVSEVKN